MTHLSGNENSAGARPLSDEGPPETPISPPLLSENRFFKPVYLFRGFSDGVPAKVLGPKGVAATMEKAMQAFAETAFPSCVEDPDLRKYAIGFDTHGNGVLYACPEEASPLAPETSTVVFEEGRVRILAYPTALSGKDSVLVQVSIKRLPMSHLSLRKGGSTDSAPPFARDIVDELHGQLLSWARTGPSNTSPFVYDHTAPTGLTMTVFVPKSSRLFSGNKDLEISFQPADKTPVCKYCRGFHRREACCSAPKCVYCSSTAHTPLLCRFKPRVQPPAPKAKGPDSGFTVVVSKQTKRKLAAQKKAEDRAQHLRAQRSKARHTKASLAKKTPILQGPSSTGTVLPPKQASLTTTSSPKDTHQNVRVVEVALPSPKASVNPSVPEQEHSESSDRAKRAAKRAEMQLVLAKAAAAKKVPLVATQELAIAASEPELEDEFLSASEHE